MLTKLFSPERRRKRRARIGVYMAIENHVYLAKLAEQAERYEGRSFALLTTPSPLTCATQRWWRT